MHKLSLPLLAVLSLSCLYQVDGSLYNIGIGIADITGPAAEIVMMGYAKVSMVAHGIHIRQYARTFIFEDIETSKRVTFVSCDTGMMGQLIKMEVLKKLEAEHGKDVFRNDNLVLSATHTHSGPAGYMQYLMYTISSFGFVEDCFQAIVNGIVLSINRANENVQPSKLYYSEGELHDANINRSPTSYLANPDSERAKYQYDTDHTFVQLNIFDAADDSPRGVINWFAVHPTSMNNTNQLISGDNKGLASLMLEKEMEDDREYDASRPIGKGSFVAAFASTNLGDVSPNTKGPHCMDTGLPCELEHSTCNNRTQMCVASGPGEDMFESAYIIGRKQYEKASELLKLPKEEQTEIDGSVGSVFQWIDMTNYEVHLDNNLTAKTCSAAMGYSFAAGTTDGPGDFNFIQGENNTNPFWDFISNLLKEPTEEQIACHAPKPILLDTGEIVKPYEWHPDIVDTQLLKVGQMYIAPVPGEFTTMSGRRMRETIRKTVEEVSDAKNTKVVVAGLSNTYTHYITTFEEYQKQRYEAASTIYGPHTLQAYQQQYSFLANHLAQNKGIDDEGPHPPNLHDQQISFVPGVVYDNPPEGHSFGDCLKQPPPIAIAGFDKVTVEFVSGHLRNDLRSEDSFLYVEKLVEGSDQKGKEEVWTIISVDGDMETQLQWVRTNALLGQSKVQVRWSIPQETPSGTFRIRHAGKYKHLLLGLTDYEGTTNNFVVKANPSRRPIIFANTPAVVGVNDNSRDTRSSNGASSSNLFNVFLFLLNLLVFYHKF